MTDAGRVLDELRALDALTGGVRVAWTAEWRRAREWYLERLAAVPGVTVDRDVAGNLWAELPGTETEEGGTGEGIVLIGSHLDCVPDGGWLDGCLGVLAGLEVLRGLAGREGEDRPCSVVLVDWADEEGARFGHSLLGSSLAAGLAEPEGLRELQDADGVSLADAMAENGIPLEGAQPDTDRLRGIVAALELHIEQGPVLERDGRAVSAVAGCVGVRRHRVRVEGRSAHAGATPMDARRDPVAAAARLVLDVRERAVELDGLATVGSVRARPGTPTAVAASVEVTLDLRHPTGDGLDALDAAAGEAVRVAVEAEGCTAEAELLWEIEPVPFDDGLVQAAIEVSDGGPALTSGPLHDSASLARAGVPVAMLFVRTHGGISHSREEDAADEDIAAGVHALDALVGRALERAAATGGPRSNRD